MAFLYIVMILMTIGAGLFLRVALTMVFDPYNPRLNNDFSELTDEEKKKQIRAQKKTGIKTAILSGTLICALLYLMVFFFPSSNKKTTSYQTSGNVCSICGGRLVCAVCGEKGLYCENASYGSGTDHYCNKHWGDVVEWHEKKKHK